MRRCCPVGFLEKFIAVFHVKISQNDTENSKETKTTQFSTFSCIFCFCFDNFRRLEYFKGPTRKKWVVQ